MKRRNIFFSVIIVLTMILGMYPQNAFATEIQENIQNESEKVVEEFLNSYHKISSLEPQKEFKNAENLVEEELYKELEIEVIGNIYENPELLG